MMSTRRAMVAGSVAAAVILSMTVPAAAAADDQARLDAAMEAFNERMTEAGWESQGLPDADDDGDEFETDDDLLAGDEAFEECLGELATILDGGFDEFSADGASAESEEFIFVPETETPETTEPGDMFSFDLDFQEEQVAALAFTVDESDLAELEEIIDALGSEETGECLDEALRAELEGDDDMEDIPFPMEFEVDISTEGDLGVGEQSASMGFVVAFNVFGIAVDAEVSIQLARVGRDVVGLLYFVTGEPQSGLDPLAELQFLADAL